MNHVSVSPTDGNGPTQGQKVFPPEGQKVFNSHPGQSFSLSLCGPISISRDRNPALHITLYSVNSV